MFYLKTIKEKLFPYNKVATREISSPSYINRHPGKTALIMAPGPSCREHQNDIQHFIDKENPILMLCNNMPEAFAPTYHCFVNRHRFMSYSRTIHPDAIPLLSPTFTDKQIQNAIGNQKFEFIMLENEYPPSHAAGIIIDKDGIIRAKGATVAVIAASIAVCMGCKTILLAGTDGYRRDELITHHYEEKDNKSIDELMTQVQWHHDNFSNLSKIMRARNGSLKIITPTVYEEVYDSHVLNLSERSVQST